VREEGESLILCAGIPARWLDQETPIRFGPAPTRFGPVSISITPDPDNTPRVDWQGDWHHCAPPIEIRLPGFAPTHPETGAGSIILIKMES
jgi:hypothetical protein